MRGEEIFDQGISRQIIVIRVRIRTTKISS